MFVRVDSDCKSSLALASRLTEHESIAKSLPDCTLKSIETFVASDEWAIGLVVSGCNLASRLSTGWSAVLDVGCCCSCCLLMLLLSLIFRSIPELKYLAAKSSSSISKSSSSSS